MNTFEDKLLTELKTVVAENTQGGRPTLRKRRMLIGAAACVTLAAGTAVAVPLIGGEKTTSPAYSVTVESTGQVTVNIVRFEDAEGLERALAKVSVSADVHYLSRHQACRRTPAGVRHFENARQGPRMPLIKSDGSGTMTVDPAKLKGATLTIEASFEDGLTATPSPGLLRGSLSINVLKNGTFGPCVVAVDR